MTETADMLAFRYGGRPVIFGTIPPSPVWQWIKYRFCIWMHLRPANHNANWREFLYVVTHIIATRNGRVAIWSARHSADL